jgi:hypothetical protein
LVQIKMSSSNIIMSPCELVKNPWTFTVDSPPPMPDSNYTAQFKSNGNYLSISNTGVVSMSKTPQNLYVRSFNGVSYILTTVLIDTNGNYGVVTSSGTGELVTGSNLATQTNVILSKDGSIFNIQTGVRYVPSTDGTSLLPGGTPGQWLFTPTTCDLGSAVPPGKYIIGFNIISTKGNKVYMIVSNGVLTLVSDPPTPTNFSNYVWNYDTNKMLSSNCVSKNYIAYNSKSPTIGLSTTVSGASAVNFLNNAIGLDPITFIVPTNSGPIPYSCAAETIIQSQMFFYYSIESTIPTSIGAGSYKIQFGNSCINSSGQMDNCNNSAFWEYDPKANTLINTLNGQCLLNTNTDVCSSNALTVGSCSDTSKSARFILGENGQLYDPVTSLCYNNPSTSSRSVENYNNQVIENFNDKNEKSIISIVVFVCLVVAFCALGFFFLRKNKRN